MDARTCNLILCCKGHVKDAHGDPLYAQAAVAKYLSDECDCPEHYYQGTLLERILKEALYDFFSGATNPGFELRQFFEVHVFSHEPTLNERIMAYFSIVQCRSETGYINGFNESILDECEDYLHSL